MTLESTIPVLEFPNECPARINEHADAVCDESLAWTQAHDLLNADKVEEFRRVKLGYIAAMTNPHLPRESLRLVTDWYFWLYAMDDGYIDLARLGEPCAPIIQMCARLSRVAVDPEFPLDGAGRGASALRDLRLRIDEAATTVQLKRWIDSVNAYLMGLSWEVANQETRQFPALEEYVAMRRPASGTWTALLLMDIAAGYELGVPQLADRRFRELVDMAVDLIGLDNDFYSYAKEQAETRAMHNIIRAIADRERCTLDEAMLRYVEIHDDRTRRLLAIEEEIGGGLTDEGRRFVHGCKDWVRGNIEYSRSSERFTAYQLQ
ncbi:terpene synthase family protein [Actinomadura fibrosa]|uniref:Terpene synthase n=1 Tax=Actinomadura fibrosa TaxID=111802 RepID=A0ABW2XK15_9ACTN|nr:hypothetical protein [Actinomadura fibrosa]